MRPEALRLALDGPEDLIVIDELPYLMAGGPGRAIPSILQSLIDSSRDALPDGAEAGEGLATPRAKHIIVCGSSLSVMSELLSGTKALRGRAELDLQLRPFDFRRTASFYDVGDPQVALHLYGILGGTPGYRDLVGAA